MPRPAASLSVVTPLRPRSVLPVSLGSLARSSGAEVLGASRPAGDASWASVQVTGVTLDSRRVLAGDLYAALPGAHLHGAQFAAAALASGAVAVLTDGPGAALLPADVPAPVLVIDQPRAVLGAMSAAVYGHPSTALRTIGITGTNGKTTTAYLVDSALRDLGARTGLIGTVETRVGDRRLASSRTTPEAPDLHATLALMREEGTDTVVMEVSSHALALHRVDGVLFDLAVFTNLSQDHLDFHPSMSDYFEAKASLFTAVRSRRGVVCVDDDWGRKLAGRVGIPRSTVAVSGLADWTIADVRWPQLTLTGPEGLVMRLICHLPGTFNVVNTAMAAVALHEAGYAVADIERAMARPPVVPGRMQQVPAGPGDPRCVVDYAHTPEAVAAALEALRPSTPGRLVVVLGAGGDRDRSKRQAMGAAAARWADDVIVTDDNPRSEDPAAIRDEVMAGARLVDEVGAAGDAGANGRPWAAQATLRSPGAGRAADIARAVRLARTEGRPQDNTVAVLGKGHETGQDVGGVILPFDDCAAVAAALADRPYRPEGDQ